MSELRIPEDYKEPLEKEIIYVLDKFPEKIKEKELEIMELNKKGNQLDLNIKLRNEGIIKLMEVEGKYIKGTPQFAQVFQNRCMIDIEIKKNLVEKEELKLEIQKEKINLNYLVNGFKGAQAIVHRKVKLEE